MILELATLLGLSAASLAAFIGLLRRQPKYVRESLRELAAINSVHNLARLDELYQANTKKENDAPKQRRKFDELIDSLLCGVVIHHKDQIVAANTHFCLWVGVPEVVLLGSNIHHVLTTDNKSIIRGYFTIARPLNILQAFVIHQRQFSRLPVNLRSIVVYYPNVGKCHLTSVLERK